MPLMDQSRNITTVNFLLEVKDGRMCYVLCNSEYHLIKLNGTQKLGQCV